MNLQLKAKLRLKTYRFLVDGVTESSLVRLKRALGVIPEVTRMDFDIKMHILVLDAVSNPEKSVRIACRIVGAFFRTRIR